MTLNDPITRETHMTSLSLWNMFITAMNQRYAIRCEGWSAHPLLAASPHCALVDTAAWDGESVPLADRFSINTLRRLANGGWWVRPYDEIDYANPQASVGFCYTEAEIKGHEDGWRRIRAARFYDPSDTTYDCGLDVREGDYARWVENPGVSGGTWNVYHRSGGVWTLCGRPHEQLPTLLGDGGDDRRLYGDFSPGDYWGWYLLEDTRLAYLKMKRWLFPYWLPVEFAWPDASAWTCDGHGAEATWGAAASEAEAEFDAATHEEAPGEHCWFEGSGTIGIGFVANAESGQDRAKADFGGDPGPTGLMVRFFTYVRRPYTGWEEPSEYDANGTGFVEYEWNAIGQTTAVEESGGQFYRYSDVVGDVDTRPARCSDPSTPGYAGYCIRGWVAGSLTWGYEVVADGEGLFTYG